MMEIAASNGETAMFQGLDEQIERTEGGHASASSRLIRVLEAAIASVIVLGGLYFAIVALE